jgi:hypothetical protein
VIADTGNHAVVLVTEVGVQARPIAETSVDEQVVRNRGNPSAARDDVRPVRSSLHRLRSPNSKARTHTCTCASKTRRSDHHDQTIRARDPIESRMAAASRDPNIDCGSTIATRPPAGSTSSPASARNSAAASAYGPPPRRLVPPRVVAVASCERNGGLPITRSNRCDGQVMDSASACRSSVAAGSAVACRGDRAGVDVAAGEHRGRTERIDAAAGRGEEPAVAARRVEHSERTRPPPDELRRDHGLDDGLHQIRRGVPGTELLANAGHRRRLRPASSSCGRVPQRRALERRAPWHLQSSP